MLAKQNLSLAAIILVVGFVGSRLLGLVRNMVIGGVFGTGPELDAYFAAFRIPDFLFQVIAGAALGSAFIPVFTTYLTKEGLEESWKLASAVLNLVGLATLAASIVALLAAPWIVPLTVPFFPSESQQLTTGLTVVMLVSPVFFSVSGIVTGILNGRHHFLLPALAPLVYNGSIIAAAVGLSASLGIYSLAVGVVAGALLHLMVQVPGLWQGRMAYRWLLGFSHQGVREVGRLMAPRVLALAAVQVNFLITTILASALPSGSLAALSYAWAVMMMPLGVFGMSISTAVFPTMAEQAAVESYDNLGRTLTSSLRLVLFFTIPASAGLILLREPLVALLFERGLFDSFSTRATSWALLFYSVGLFAHAMIEVLTRGFYALHDTRTPVGLAAASVLVNVVLSLALMRPLGHGGLALSLSVATILEAVVLFSLLHRHVPSLGHRTLLNSLGRVCVATGLMAVAVVLMYRVGFGAGGSWPALETLAVVALGAVVFLLTTLVLGSDEAAMLKRWLLAGR